LTAISLLSREFVLVSGAQKAFKRHHTLLAVAVQAQSPPIVKCIDDFNCLSLLNVKFVRKSGKESALNVRHFS